MPDPQTAAEPGSATILVVEDFAPMSVLVERVLTTEGHRVTTAASGLAAEAACATTDFDLIVTDVHIPGGNGVDMARHVAERRPGLKVLFVSGDPERDLDLTLPGGRTDFLQKPFDIYELVERVARLLADE
jgi:DNA-binding response OmpR family regulator